MATIQELKRLVDEIRAYVYSVDQTSSEPMRQLASRYANECRSANERLTRCGDLLDRGFRAQAIALSEVEPDLLELVEVVAFSELDQWQELTATYEGVERCRPLNQEVANSLAAAYEPEQQLEKLHRRHRRLALAQAPLKERLGAMRHIASIDTAVFWREDVARFEGHLVREIMVQAQKATQRGDMGVLRQWIGEFESEPWTDPPAEESVSQYKKLARLVHESTTLPTLGRQILAATQRSDLTSAAALRGRWDEVAHRLMEHDPQWSLPARLQLSMSSAFSWMDEQFAIQRKQAFLEDAGLLHQALQADAEREHIDALLARAESYGEPFPPGILARIEAFRRNVRRGERLNKAIVGAIGLAAIIVVAIGGFMVRAMFFKG
ncbi:MAG TPA: hypothetical protein VF278_06395 [Pirellulales bacterium]